MFPEPHSHKRGPRFGVNVNWYRFFDAGQVAHFEGVIPTVQMGERERRNRNNSWFLHRRANLSGEGLHLWSEYFEGQLAPRANPSTPTKSSPSAAKGNAIDQASPLVSVRAIQNP